MATIASILSRELSVPETYIEHVIRLLDEGNTLPFIARYRKELHGALTGYDDGRVTIEAAGETLTFEKQEVALVRLYVEF